MEATQIIRIIVVVMGVFFFGITFHSYAKRKLTEIIGLFWGFISLFIVLIAVIPGLSAWVTLIPEEAFAALVLVFFFSMLGVFFLSISVSKLSMKNQELAMQVSLLNQENERILRELENVCK